LRRARRLPVRSGSSTNMIEIFNEMYVQDADRNSGSSAFLRPNCAAHGTLHMNRSTRRSNTVTTDNCWDHVDARSRVDCRVVPSVFYFLTSFLNPLLRVNCSTFISRYKWPSCGFHRFIICFLFTMG
jgi:hypothetical protein